MGERPGCLPANPLSTKRGNSNCLAVRLNVTFILEGLGEEKRMFGTDTRRVVGCTGNCERDDPWVTGGL
jgi:hypothetical protein